MKESIKTGKEKAKADRYTKMEIFTKENFPMTNSIGKEKKIIKIKEFISESIIKGRKVVKVLLIF